MVGLLSLAGNKHLDNEKLNLLIGNRDDEINTYLEILFRYGAVDVLVYLCSTLRLFGNETDYEWFLNKIVSLEGSADEFVKEVFRIEKSFSKEDYLFIIGDPEDAYERDITFSEFEERVWERLDKDFLKSFYRSNEKVIGLYCPGLEQNSPNRDFMVNLEKKVFPAFSSKLEMCKNNSVSLIEKDYLRSLYDAYVSFLSRYYQYSSVVLAQVLEKDTREIANMNDRDFGEYVRKVWSEYNETEVYVSLVLTEAIDKIVQYKSVFYDYRDHLVAEFFGLQFLYLLSGDLMSAKSNVEKSPNFYLYYLDMIICYRFSIRYPNDNSLISRFDYKSKAGYEKSQFLTWAKQVQNFLEEFSSTLDNEYKSLKKDCDANWDQVRYCIEELYLSKLRSKRLIEYEKKNPSRHMNYVVEKWFIGGKLSSVSEELIQKIGECDSFSASKAISDLIKLFSGLVSHIDGECRILLTYMTSVLRDNHDFERTNEIFYIYNDDETAKLKLLNDRFQAMRLEIPSEDWQNSWNNVRTKIDAYRKEVITMEEEKVKKEPNINIVIENFTANGSNIAIGTGITQNGNIDNSTVADLDMENKILDKIDEVIASINSNATASNSEIGDLKELLESMKKNKKQRNLELLREWVANPVLSSVVTTGITALINLIGS